MVRRSLLRKLDVKTGVRQMLQDLRLQFEIVRLLEEQLLHVRVHDVHLFAPAPRGKSRNNHRLRHVLCSVVFVDGHGPQRDGERSVTPLWPVGHVVRAPQVVQFRDDLPGVRVGGGGTLEQGERRVNGLLHRSSSLSGRKYSQSSCSQRLDCAAGSPSSSSS